MCLTDRRPVDIADLLECNERNLKIKKVDDSIDSFESALTPYAAAWVTLARVYAEFFQAGAESLVVGKQPGKRQWEQQ